MCYLFFACCHEFFNRESYQFVVPVESRPGGGGGGVGGGLKPSTPTFLQQSDFLID